MDICWAKEDEQNKEKFLNLFAVSLSFGLLGASVFIYLLAMLKAVDEDEIEIGYFQG